MYLHWNKQIITDFSEANIGAMYDRGFVFTRVGKGVMNQTRSIRIDLSDWETTSENRRILRKTEELRLKIENLPFANYSWEIGKMGKKFYETKFGDGTFSANKIKELMTGKRDDFNRVLYYVIPNEVRNLSEDASQTLRKTSEKSKIPASKDPSVASLPQNDIAAGYCIAVETANILHYSYPFYNLNSEINNLGMGMMLRAIQYAKEADKKYVYLGSFQRPTDIYKLQFTGLEWFDGTAWQSDVVKLKKTIQ